MGMRLECGLYFIPGSGLAGKVKNQKLQYSTVQYTHTELHTELPDLELGGTTQSLYFIFYILHSTFM